MFIWLAPDVSLNFFCCHLVFHCFISYCETIIFGGASNSAILAEKKNKQVN